jgi:glycerate-2-kinase
VGVRHIVLADNGTLVRCLDEKLRRKHPLAHISILPFSNEPLDVVARNLVRNINRRIEIARRSGREQFLILGCEPTLRLPPGFKNGGRQTHLAALLLSRFLPRIAAGELKILCAASDGIDGGSKSMGAFLNARVASHFQKSASLQTLEKSLRDFNSATALKKADALLLPRDTSTNVQDVVVVQIRPIARTDRRRV